MRWYWNTPIRLMELCRWWLTVLLANRIHRDTRVLHSKIQINTQYTHWEENNARKRKWNYICPINQTHAFSLFLEYLLVWLLLYPTNQRTKKKNEGICFLCPHCVLLSFIKPILTLFFLIHYYITNCSLHIQSHNTNTHQRIPWRRPRKTFWQPNNSREKKKISSANWNIQASKKSMWKIEIDSQKSRVPNFNEMRITLLFYLGLVRWCIFSGLWFLASYSIDTIIIVMDTHIIKKAFKSIS